TLVFRDLPPAQQRLQTAVRKEMQAQMIQLAPQLMDGMAKVYGETLTEKELRDYLAWLRTESGQSIQRKAPLLASRNAQVTVPLVMAAMPKVLKSAIDRACDEAQCTAQDRQIIADAMAKSMPKQPS
ncbi:MAG: DUF2059 domain-containing protein, partial [Caulobacteraceae bacterium]